MISVQRCTQNNEEYAKAWKEANAEEYQSVEPHSEEEYIEEYRKIMQCLDAQAPEINHEWAEYVTDKTEETEYLGKYYYIFVGEQWEDHCSPWAYFYAEGETTHTYEGYFYLHTYTDIWQDIDLYITKLESFSGGTLYALELEQPDSTDPFEQLLDRKYIGYFYVTDEYGYHAYMEVDGDILT
ncbi:MAG: hypothetical protein NC118_03655 [Eubacterium sp.]|nr:hypothetical protein [Eubacterium sp.]